MMKMMMMMMMLMSWPARRDDDEDDDDDDEEEDDDDDDDDSSLTTIPSALGKGIIMTISANKRQIKTGQGVPKFRPGPPPQTANPSYGSTGGYKRWRV